MTQAPRDRVIRLTPAGTAALATIRLDGPSVGRFVAGHIGGSLVPGRRRHAYVRDHQGVVDDVVAYLHPGGSRLDVTCHGGVSVVESILELAERSGMERVRFDPLAVDSIALMDGGTWLDREVTAGLALARTEVAAWTLLDQAARWGAFLAGGPSVDRLADRLGDPTLRRLLVPPAVAIVGLPNAGKSTLANRLFGRSRSIVSPVPGTTRDWVGEEANLEGLLVRLLDTPGLHATTDPLESQAITAAQPVVKAADLVMLVLDASRTLESQQSLMRQFPGAVPILNRADQELAEWRDAGHIRTVAAEDVNTGAVRAVLRGRLLGPDPHAPMAWTDRHRELLEGAIRTGQAPSELLGALTGRTGDR